MKTMFFSAASLIFVGTLATAQIPLVNKQTDAAAGKLGAAMTAQISFDEGKSELNSGATEKINETINNARKEGRIEEIRVVTWADREYPAKGEKAPKAAVRLADERAKTLKNYLNEELKAGKVKTFNMAKRPNALQEMLSTPTAKVKDTLEGSGSAPTAQEDTGLFGLDGKSSQGVVLIYLKK